ncbi:MAG: serine hydrolase [bacterium]|nr:serine hydrolase [bacterium]
MKRTLLPALILTFAINVTAQVPERTTVLAGAERAFEKASKTNSGPAPGCAVGVSLNGETVFEKAFGLAEMEHSISNTPQTIFESGSVAKQFTAAALVLLEKDGKLKIDDDVRKYIPELPEYGKPITIRHILTHTAGLRDWGSVMQLTGVGRGDRVVNQAIALDVIYRQKYLDFVPGAEYSYSNSGYQLAAEIVERVSKQKFGEFVSERIFKPLGMTKSSWRDEYRRLVPGRAQGYSKAGPNAPWMLNMPFMNVIGNGGMLTTAGDWLKWNAALDAKTFGEPFVAAMETQGILNDGRKISYALGLNVDSEKGIKQVTHSGGTAGYQTFLARFPDRRVSVAALCNGFPPSAGDIVYGVFDEVFGPFPEPAKVETVAVAEDQLRKYAGVWRNDVTRNANPIVLDKGELKLNGGPLKPLAAGLFMLGDRKLTFNDGTPVTANIANSDGSVTRLTLVSEWKPTASDLSEFSGDWYSEEAQAKFAIAVEGDKAFIKQAPSMKMPLQPLSYKDHLAAQGFVVWVTRDASGKIDRLHVGGSRMRDMYFSRVN